MNKKIKMIDVINKIANGEIPKAIKYHNKIYKYVKNEEEEGYLNADFGGDWLINIIQWDDIKELNQEVEILEDNTEEIETIDDVIHLDSFVEVENDLTEVRKKINELVRTINQMRKEKENE